MLELVKLLNGCVGNHGASQIEYLSRLQFFMLQQLFVRDRIALKTNDISVSISRVVAFPIS